jgi:hypothetical protein
MKNTDKWLTKKLKAYEYLGEIKLAVNKPHAAELFGIGSYKEMAKIKKAST